MQRYRDWALTLFRWDGLLPLAVFSAPEVVAFLFPGKQEVTFLVVPPIAFAVRLVIGIECSQNGQVYAWQFVMFLIALFVLFVFDAMLIMVQVVRNGVPVGAWLILAALYLVYLGLMALALFPVRGQWADKRAEAETEFGPRSWMDNGI